MKNIEKVKECLLKEKHKRFFWENIVIQKDDFFYKTLNRMWKIMHHWENKYKSVVENIELIEEYFWNICEIAETEVIKDEDFFYIIKQKKLNWNILKFRDLKHKKVKNKMIEIMKINNIFWKEKWLFLDIFWTDVLFKPHSIHNLMIDDDKIFIFDFWLLNKNSPVIIFRILSYFFYYLQNFLFKILIKFL